MAGLIDDLKKLGALEITSQENAAFIRLRQNKDFKMLLDVLGRWDLTRAFELLDHPRPGQDADLVTAQGIHQALKKIITLVESAAQPPGRGD